MDQSTNPLNVARFALAKPGLFPVMLHKVMRRFSGSRSRYSDAENLRWISAHSVRSGELAWSLDPALWTEAVEFAAALAERTDRILGPMAHELGTGGDYAFIYWLVRHKRPRVVVETGVAAGGSSQAILAAMEKNGFGKLYSSDFPYFRLKDPEQYIGILVEEHLKYRWHLSTDGDENGLPRIVAQVQQIDLFIYDSDKSYSGREFGFRTVSPKLAPDAVMLIDDISNDSWFREHVEATHQTFKTLHQQYGLIYEV